MVMTKRGVIRPVVIPRYAAVPIFSSRTICGLRESHVCGISNCSGSERATTGATINLMEVAVQIHVKLLPEGVFLATFEQLPGLVAQGRTVAEALEIARDVARRLIEARREREGALSLPPAAENQDFTIVVAA